MNWHTGYPNLIIGIIMAILTLIAVIINIYIISIIIFGIASALNLVIGTITNNEYNKQKRLSQF